MMFGGGSATAKTSRVIRHSCIKIVPRRQPFSTKSNNSSSHSSAIQQVEAANKKSDSLTVASAIKDTALSKINNIASQATQLAKSKATNAVTHASNTIRTSLHNTKVNAKIKTEQYAWEAHRSLNKARTEMETKIKNKANQTREQIQHSVKEELSKRMPQFIGGGSKNSNSVQAQTKSSATAAQIEPTILKNSIPSDKTKQSSIPSSISSLLPSKETILSSATTTALSNTATETLNRTTSNLSTQFTSTIHKAFKWLWWWGLAAVGVYGISTTLTKEGVALLKDVVVGGTTSSGEKKSSSLLSTLSSVSKDDEVNDGFEVVSESSSNKQQDPPNQERWSSWLSSWRKGSK